MKHFVIRNLYDKEIKPIEAELRIDHDGDLSLEINGDILLFIETNGRLRLMGTVELIEGTHEFKIADSVMEGEE